MATSGAFEHNVEGSVVTAAEIKNIAHLRSHIEDLFKSDDSLTEEPTGRITIEGFECAGGLNSRPGPFVQTGLDAHGFR
jgi:hypothetical protein